MAAKHVDDAARAVKTAARHADDLPRARRALPGMTPHGGAGASAAAPIANQLRRPEGLLNRVGGWLHAATKRGLSKVIHGWLGNTKLHDPLASLSNRLGFKTCFTAGLRPRLAESIQVGLNRTRHPRRWRNQRFSGLTGESSTLDHERPPASKEE